MDMLTQALEMQLQGRAEGHRLKRLRNVVPGKGAEILVDGRSLINFASNDYLALSSHPLLTERAIEFTRLFGTGSGASRLICGNLEVYERIERKLASLKGTEAALILPCGFQTNLTALPAVAALAPAHLACDRLSHNSLLQGAQLSGARWSRFKHNDLNDLNARLRSGESTAKQKWIVTESVFSMDGDRCDLAAIRQLSEKHGAHIYLDEAHATGILGEFGMGLSAGQTGVTIAMGTFSKACGSFGAYIACSKKMRDYLVNACSGLIYSTALPPGVLGAIDAALDLLPRLEKQRQVLLESAERLRNQLHKMGFETAGSTTQIVPIVVGTDQAAVSLARHLEDGGIFAPAIRPPTVPEGSARVRVTLTSHHTYEQLSRVVSLVRNWHER